MIHHVSIPAHDPEHVTRVLAEVMHGAAYPFPGNVPGAFMAVSGDSHGTMIEVYPSATQALPGADGGPVELGLNAQPPTHWPFHLLLSVAAEEQEILAVAAREGWHARRYGRGAPGAPPMFEVIEFWVENSFMLELAPADLIGAYETLFQPHNLAEAGINPI